MTGCLFGSNVVAALLSWILFTIDTSECYMVVSVAVADVGVFLCTESTFIGEPSIVDWCGLPISDDVVDATCVLKVVVFGGYSRTDPGYGTYGGGEWCLVVVGRTIDTEAEGDWTTVLAERMFEGEVVSKGCLHCPALFAPKLVGCKAWSTEGVGSANNFVSL